MTTDAEVAEALTVLRLHFGPDGIMPATVRTALTAAAAARPVPQCPVCDGLGIDRADNSPCPYCRPETTMCANIDTLPPGERSAYAHGFADGKAARPMPQAGEVVNKLRKIVSHAPVGMPHSETILEAADLLTAQAAEISAKDARIQELESLDREAALHVESIICMRSKHFTGDPPYVGWEGLGIALRQDYDSLAAKDAEIANERQVFHNTQWRQLQEANARTAELEAALREFVDTQGAYIEALPGERGMSVLTKARALLAPAGKEG